MEYRLKVYRGPSAIDEVAPAWAAVTAQMHSPHFFQCHPWYAAYAAALDPSPADAIYCVIEEDGAPAAILPLKQELRTVGGIKLRTLELPRHDHMHLRDIAVRDSSRATLGADQIVRLLRQARELRWDVLALWHLLDDSCAMTAHRHSPAARSIAARRFGCSSMPLGSWNDFEQRLSKNHRKNLRHSNNRAKTIEGLHIEIAKSPSDLERALPAFLEVEASGWKAESGTAIRLDARLAAFYHEVTRRFGQMDSCEIRLLKIKDQPIAGLYSLFSGQTAYGPKAAYEEAHGRLSPVHLLLESLFKDLCNQGRYTHFNAISDSGWFDVWKPQLTDVHNIYTFNSTLMGLAAYTGMTVATRWRNRAA